MLAHSLHIYYNDKEGNKHYFPDDNSPAILRKWKYSASRQKEGVPTVEATLPYPSCLDNSWYALKPYIILDNGDVLYADQIHPDSSKSNTELCYSHTLRFVSHRARLNNILFFDAVSPDLSSLEKDKYRSNFTDFQFYGTLEEFVNRLESSLKFNKISDFSFVFDDGVDKTIEKEVSFSDVYMNEAIDNILSSYDTNYYWIGNVCHIGDCENDIDETKSLAYGYNKGLLSVKKNNSSERIINAITGFGGAKNIPFYYPNDEEYGTTHYNTYNIDKSRINIDWSKLYSLIGIRMGVDIMLSQRIVNDGIVSLNDFYTENKAENIQNFDPTDGSGHTTFVTTATVTNTKTIRIQGSVGAVLDMRSMLDFGISVNIVHKDGSTVNLDVVEGLTKVYLEQGGNRKDVAITNATTKINLDYIGITSIIIETVCDITYEYDSSITPVSFNLVLDSNGKDAIVTFGRKNEKIWRVTDNGKHTFVSYDKAGISIPDTVTNIADITTKWSNNNEQGKDKIFFFETTTDATAVNAVRIRPISRDYFTPVGKLVPSIYRESFGEERFYYAKNHNADDDCTNKLSSQHTSFIRNGEYLSFGNEYNKDNIMQAVQSFEDIEPTIKNIRNANGELISEILDVAFDDNDNDEVDSNGKYKHPYFYIKLRRFDGEYGFDLFSHALKGEEAKIIMTSCNGCPSCTFTIQSIYGNDGRAYNPVMTDNSGNLLVGEYVNKLASNVAMCVPANQDTRENSIWIAVSKEESTLGTIMPSAVSNLKPITGDKFVLVGISFPVSYIRAAEKELDYALVDYMKENNEGTFDYSVILSRIYLESNKDIASLINENARLYVTYNGTPVRLFVSSYAVSISEDVLADITIELTPEFRAIESRITKAIKEATKGNKQAIQSEQKSNERTSPEIGTRSTSSEHTSNDSLPSWSDIAGKPSWVTNSKPNVSIFPNDAGYITKENIPEVDTSWDNIKEKPSWVTKDVPKVSVFPNDAGYLNKDGIEKSRLRFKEKTTHIKGLQIGEAFTSGLAGKGGMIDENANAELESLKTRGFIESPELRYNRISINVGVDWNTPCGGIIESVTPSSDGSETGQCVLKLEDGEYGAVKEGDLCMGIWHDEGGNETETVDDHKGNFKFAGFKTVYFHITSVSGANNNIITYLLRSESDGGNGIHPFPGMHFAGRGSTTDTNRQGITYKTPLYSLSLMNVSTWEFQPENYYGLEGYVNNFVWHAVDEEGNTIEKIYNGYVKVMGQAYIYGKLDFFERQGYRMFIDQSKGGMLAPNESEEISVTIVNGYGTDVTGRFTNLTVTRNSGDEASDEAWNAEFINRHRDPDTGISIVPNPFTISFSDLGIDGIHRLMTVFRVVATDEDINISASQQLDYFS